MKIFKKIFLVAALILVISVSTRFSVAAAGAKSSNYKESCKMDGSAQDVNSLYNLKVSYLVDGKFNLTARKSAMKIVAIEEGLYNSNDNIFTPVALQHLKTNYNSLIGKIISPSTASNSKPVEVQLIGFDTRGQDDNNARVVRVTVELAESDDKCQSRADYDQSIAQNKNAGMYTGYYILPLSSFKGATPAQQKNTDYSTPACTALRTGSNNGAIDESVWAHYNSSGIATYQRLVPFCYNAGDVDSVYGATKVKKMVTNAIQSYHFKNLIDKAVNNKKQDASFEQAFLASYNRAYNAKGKHFQSNLSSPKDLAVPDDLKCEYTFDKIGKQTILPEESDSAEYEYTNLQSFYASTQEVNNSLQYVLNYDGGNKKTINAGTCQRTCEEAVDVEYGPPQIAVAGLCFEYQVKVTSRVKCTTQANLDFPPAKQQVCQPEPQCLESNGVVRTQAGPNQEFEECINKCDGGKYTQSCSTKCYNEVYKNSGKKNLSSINSASARFVSSVSDLPQGGYYTRDASGNVIWRSTGKTYSSGTYAQWYIDQEPQKTLHDDKQYGSYHFFPDSGGFKRAQYSNGKECDAECSYIGCEDQNTYLRQESVDSDYQLNMEKYLKAVEECAAAATCTTKTATFKIAATYKDKNNGKTYTVYYPYTSRSSIKEGTYNKDVDIHDNLTSPENKNSKQNSLQGSLLSYNGCYADSNANDWYQSEWTFPGTWVNNKTGEISFENPNSDKAWHQSKNTFCLPLNVAETNKDWWNYFFKNKQQFVNQDVEGSYTQKPYTDACKEIAQAQLPTNIDWNINAQTKLFGYFGWEFNIKCFYAVSEDTTNTKCDVDPGNYDTRTVNPSELFPSDDEKGTETNSSVDASITGRAPGFNWTEAAAIPEYKNDVYAINPPALIAKIQRAGKSIYDTTNESENLDYEFKLSSRDLRAIKKDTEDNLGGDYNKWNGKSDYDEKVRLYIYRSSLFRDGGVISDRSKAVKLGLLGCNNQLNQNSCDYSLVKGGI